MILDTLIVSSNMTVKDFIEKLKYADPKSIVKIKGSSDVWIYVNEDCSVNICNEYITDNK